MVINGTHLSRDDGMTEVCICCARRIYVMNVSRDLAPYLPMYVFLTLLLSGMYGGEV